MNTLLKVIYSLRFIHIGILRFKVTPGSTAFARGDPRKTYFLDHEHRSPLIQGPSKLLLGRLVPKRTNIPRPDIGLQLRSHHLHFPI
jgi:hypothetical protein